MQAAQLSNKQDAKCEVEMKETFGTYSVFSVMRTT